MKCKWCKNNSKEKKSELCKECLNVTKHDTPVFGYCFDGLLVHAYHCSSNSPPFMVRAFDVLGDIELELGFYRSANAAEFHFNRVVKRYE